MCIQPCRCGPADVRRRHPGRCDRPTAPGRVNIAPAAPRPDRPTDRCGGEQAGRAHRVGTGLRPRRHAPGPRVLCRGILRPRRRPPLPRPRRYPPVNGALPRPHRRPHHRGHRPGRRRRPGRQPLGTDRHQPRPHDPPTRPDDQPPPRRPDRRGLDRVRQPRPAPRARPAPNPAGRTATAPRPTRGPRRRDTTHLARPSTPTRPRVAVRAHRLGQPRAGHGGGGPADRPAHRRRAGHQFPGSAQGARWVA
jgi:hypothetical protein